MAVFLTYIADHLGCSLFAYDYSGYGLSTGTPSERNLYADAAAAVACVTERYDHVGCCPVLIILPWLLCCRSGPSFPPLPLPPLFLLLPNPQAHLQMWVVSG